MYYLFSHSFVFIDYIIVIIIKLIFLQKLLQIMYSLQFYCNSKKTFIKCTLYVSIRH